jgi:hypothetical protein
MNYLQFKEKKCGKTYQALQKNINFILVLTGYIFDIDKS